MRFLATFNKTKECTFKRQLKLVDDLKPHMEKHGLKLIVAMQNEDGTRIYDVGEAETMEGIEAFISDPEYQALSAELLTSLTGKWVRHNLARSVF